VAFSSFMPGLASTSVGTSDNRHIDVIARVICQAEPIARPKEGLRPAGAHLPVIAPHRISMENDIADTAHQSRRRPIVLSVVRCLNWPQAREARAGVDPRGLVCTRR